MEIDRRTISRIGKLVLFTAILLACMLLPFNCRPEQTYSLSAPVTIQYQVDADYPPYTSMIDSHLMGFDPYLMHLIFSSPDYILQYSTDSWSNVYRRLVDGSIDIAGIIAVTQEREKEVLFTKPLFKSYVSVYTLSDFRQIRIQDLGSLRVGVGRGYYTESILKNHLGITDYVPYDNLRAAIKDLLSGNIDVIFENQQLMEYLLIQEHHKGSVIAQITNLFPREHAYAVSKDHPELLRFMNHRIDELKRMGVFEEIYMKYFYSHSDGYFATRNRQIGLGILLSLIFVGLLLYLMQQVNKKLKLRLHSSLLKLDNANVELVSANKELSVRYNEIHTLAYHNTVTSLPNKNRFHERLEQLIQEDRKLILFYLDLDNFKEINDTHGHFVGDEVLKAVAENFRKLETEVMKIYNLAGDEFICCLKEMKDRPGVEQIAKALLDCVSQPVTIQESIFHISASMGIVYCPEHGNTFDELLKNADAAMYTAKKNKKGTFTFFNQEIGQTVLEKTKLLNSLRHALHNNEFTLHYQPQISEKTHEIFGFEALLRWNSPQKGLVSPDIFIAVAEESHLIIPIGEWVLKTAANFMYSLNQITGCQYIVSVNVSAVQLHQENYVERVIAILKETKLAPHLLELEITESCLLEDTASVIHRLEELRAFGINIALDDFGTGYSSLGYLRDLPVKTIKIDRSFVNTLFVSKKNQSLVRIIVSIGHALGMELVAEGVETEQQQEYLHNLKCDRIQGYLVSKPLNENGIVSFLKQFEDNE